MSMPFKIDGVDSIGYGFPKKVVTLHTAATAISAGDWVEIDPAVTTYGAGASVVKATTTTLGEYLTVGVATETITAAGFIQVQVAGKYLGANVATASAAGDALGASATAGRLATVDTAEAGEMAHAVCIAEAAGDTADVMIIDKGWF